MADVSAEPSMEEILSSIKRIIAEEEGAPARRRSAARTAVSPQDEIEEADEGILELSQPLPREEPPARPFSPPPAAAALPPPVEAPRTPEPEPAPVAAPAAPLPQATAVPPPAPPPASPSASEAPPVDPIVSARAADATRGSLESLSRMIVRPASSGGEETLEGLVRELLKPMLRDWLDAKLPGIVETIVAREVARISGREP